MNLLNKITINNSIEKIKNYLEHNFDIKLSFGAEIEFYSSEEILNYMNDIEEERGMNQYEVKIGPIEDIQIFLSNIKNKYLEIESIAKEHNISYNFSPKPLKNDYGNALQIQFSSKNKKFQENIERICSTLCEYTNDIFLIFAATKEDYNRFDSKFMAPTHISFGYNNRSCLYRITGEKDQRRIELRASSINSNFDIIIFTIYLVIIEALNNKQKSNFSKIYGNAFDEQYNLIKIPSSQKEALELFNTRLYEKYI